MNSMNKFLRAILPDTGMYCITLIPNQGYARNVPFTSIDTACNFAYEHARNCNVYFALASYKGLDANGKFHRLGANAYKVKSFWLDVDVGDGYKTKAEASAQLGRFLKETGLPVPAVVDSGNGYHLYWCLSRAISAEVWRQAARLLRKVCAAHDFKADHHRTADIASILRVPGTLNHKHGPKPVRLMHLPETPVTPEQFIKLLVKETATATAAVKPVTVAGVDVSQLSFGDSFTKPQGEILPRTPDQMIIKCRQIREMGYAQYPAWMLAARTVLHTTGGAAMVHALSKLDKSQYDHERCQSLIDNLLSTHDQNPPGLCETFESYCPERCEGCPHRGKIKTPWALNDIAEAKAVEMPKANIETADFSHGEIALGNVTEMAKYIPYSDDQFKVIPHKGIYKIVEDENGNRIPVKISNAEVYIHTLCIDYTQGSVPKRTYIMRKVVPDCAPVDIPFAIEDALGTQKIELWTAQCGLLPAPKNRKDFYTFMNTYIAAIQNKLPEVVVRNHFGWVDCTDRATGVTYPGFIVGQQMYTAKGISQVRLDERSASVATKLGTKGSLKAWLQVPELYKTLDQKFAQLLMCTAFGAPLMKFGRGTATNVAYNFWDINGGKGKSSVLKALASVWGDPQQMLMGRTDTHAARFQQYAVYRNLPILIDELTGINDEETASLLYDIVNGREKARSTASGTGLAQSGHWDTITVFTANQSMYESLRSYKAQSSATCMRLIESVCDFKDYTNTPMALTITSAMAAARDNYGLAGAKFLSFLMEHPEIPRVVEQWADKFATKYAETSDERFWLYGIAIPLVAGKIAKALGLLTYDFDELERYCTQTLLPELRAKVKVNKPTGSNLLMDYLNDSLADTLIVHAHTRKTFDTLRKAKALKTDQCQSVHYGSFDSVSDDPYVVQLPTRQMHIRRELDTETVYISSRALSSWCRQKGISLDTMLQELQLHGYAQYGINTKRFALGKDVPTLPNGAQTVYCFRVERNYGDTTSA